MILSLNSISIYSFTVSCFTNAVQIMKDLALVFANVETSMVYGYKIMLKSFCPLNWLLNILFHLSQEGNPKPSMLGT